MKLNEKLARWAGFKTQFVSTYMNIDRPDYRWLYPNGEKTKDWMLPDFTSSLDACFNPDWGLMRKLDQAQYYEVLRSIFLKTDKPALALCEAIEQLIDKETNGS